MMLPTVPEGVVWAILLLPVASLLTIGFVTKPYPRLSGYVTIAAIGTAFLFPATSALVSRKAPREELGQVLGVQQTFGGLARVLAPIGATATFQGLGPGVPFCGNAEPPTTQTFSASHIWR